SPIGGIPAVPSLLGLIVLLTAAQILFGRQAFWLPGFIARRRVKGDRIKPAMRKMRPVIRFIDKVLKPRLTWATRGGWSRLAAAVCVVCALTVPPLELIPFASSAPFSAIALIGLGLLSRDGLFVCLGIAVAVVSLVSLSW